MAGIPELIAALRAGVVTTAEAADRLELLLALDSGRCTPQIRHLKVLRGIHDAAAEARSTETNPEYILWCKKCDWVGLSGEAVYCDSHQEWDCPECGGAEWITVIGDPAAVRRRWLESGLPGLERAAATLDEILNGGRHPCSRCWKLLPVDDLNWQEPGHEDQPLCGVCAEEVGGVK